MNNHILSLLHRRQSHCLQVAWHAAAPRKSLSVSEWSDMHRELTGKDSGERGRYRTSRTPLMREIMDCFSANSGVNDLALMKPSQYGASAATVNVIGYVMEHAPCPMMVMLPTLEARNSWKVQKLNPLLQDTTVIRDLLGGNRSRDASNREDLIDFPGGVLFLAGGNSPNSYAQKSVRIIILDDYDRFPTEVGDEGDVESLADGRTKAFTRAIRGKISTPTIKDKSLIERSYLASDQRKYHVPCPHCGEYQVLEWGGADKGYGIKWNSTHTQAWYLCKYCAAEIYEHHKPAMLRNGRWIAARPHIKARGYQWSSLYCSIGLGPSWLDMVQEWIKAQEDSSKLQTFINTALGEVWDQELKGADPNALLMRCGVELGDRAVYARTAGVDVQKDRLEISIFDWGLNEESWAVDHIIIEGDTAGDDPWDELDGELHAQEIDVAGIDTGYNTDQAKAFCEKRRWAIPLKGIEGKGKTLTEDDQARKRRLRNKRKKGFSPFLVSDQAAMSLLMQRLTLEKPGAGYMHFPKEACFDDEYFAQLTSNQLEEKKVRGKKIIAWKQSRLRNEAYDCWKMALAALRLAKIDMAARAKRAEQAKTEHESDAPKQAQRGLAIRRLGTIGNRP